ncbi:MAG: hypothetical protein ACR2RF_09885 [Geminicoccaceae bacterium]
MSATFDLKMNGRFVKQVGHKTRGCLLCQAAAAIITDQASGLDGKGPDGRTLSQGRGC